MNEKASFNKLGAGWNGSGCADSFRNDSDSDCAILGITKQKRIRDENTLETDWRFKAESDRIGENKMNYMDAVNEIFTKKDIAYGVLGGLLWHILNKAWPNIKAALKTIWYFLNVAWPWVVAHQGIWGVACLTWLGDRVKKSSNENNPSQVETQQKADSVKTISTIIAIAVLIIGLATPSFAQTNVVSPQTNGVSAITNIASTIGLNSNTVSVIQTVGSFFIDNESYFKTGNFAWKAGPLQNGHKWGGFGEILVPANTNSWQLSYGPGLGYIDHHLGLVTASLNLGTTLNVPGLSSYIGPFQLYAVTAPGYDFHTKSATALMMAGITYSMTPPKFLGEWTTNATIDLSYSYGTITSLAGQVKAYGLGMHFHF